MFKKMRSSVYIKAFACCLFLFFGEVIGVKADKKEIRLIISGNGGLEIERISISDIQKIKFVDGVILIQEKTESQRSVVMSEISKIYFSTEEPTDIFEEKVLPEAIKVYPNPAVNNITVVFGMPEAQPVVLMGMNGMVYYKNNSFRSGEMIDISRFSSGIYILRIADKNIKFQKQ